jgi:pilus assembly protein Flp/PilA
MFERFLSHLLHLFTNLRAALRRDQGATAVEYGLLVALIAAIIIVAVALLGGNVSDAFTTIVEAF